MRVELRETLRLAGPLALANLLQMAIGATDVIFVARLGQDALAVASLAVTFFFFMAFGLGSLCGAVAPLIAAELGRRRHAVREVRRSVRMALWLAMFSAVLGMALCQLGGQFMLLTGQQPELAARAQKFLNLLSLAMPPMLATYVLRTYVSALGRPLFATAITVLSIAANALGNWCFIYGHLGMPALGLDGSALATVATSTVTALAYVVAIGADRRLRRYRTFGRWWRPEWQRMREIVRIGIPIAMTVMAEGGLFSSAAFLIGKFGVAQLAAHTVALQVAALFFQIPFGIGQAATIRVGYHFGAGDAAAMGRAGSVALLSCLGFQLAGGAAMLLAPRSVLSAYVDTSAPANAAMVAYAVDFLAVAAAFQLFDGLQTVAAGALRGLQDTRMPMVIAISGYWLIGLSCCIFLGFLTPLEGVGVWIGLAVSLVVVALLLLRRWRRRERLRLLPG